MSGDAVELVVMPSGDIKTIYSERIDLAQFGKLSIRRGSHVEPTEDGQWTADLSPCGGPVLGPFRGRSEALAAEVKWLSEHWLCQAADEKTGHDAHAAASGPDREKLSMTLFRVHDIVWDTDGRCAPALGLPGKVLMQGDPERFADSLSDHFGWCVISLNVTEITGDISAAELDQLSELPLVGGATW